MTAYWLCYCSHGWSLRGDKPFAVMVADLATARDMVLLSSTEGRLLTDPRRPVVLLARRSTGHLPTEPLAADVTTSSKDSPHRNAHSLADGPRQNVRRTRRRK